MPKYEVYKYETDERGCYSHKIKREFYDTQVDADEGYRMMKNACGLSNTLRKHSNPNTRNLVNCCIDEYDPSED